MVDKIASIISAPLFISPWIAVLYMVLTFVAKTLRPKNHHRAVLHLVVGLLILGIPTTAFFFTEDSAQAGLGLLVIIAFVSTGYLAVLLAYILHIIFLTRRLRRENQLTNTPLPSWGGATAWMLGGIIGSVVAIQLGSLLVAVGVKNAYPYGVGRTKETQFTGGGYVSANINGKSVSRFQVNVEEAFNRSSELAGNEICVFGRYTNNSGLGILSDPTTNRFSLQSGDSIYVPANNAETLTCPTNDFPCSARVTLCGHFEHRSIATFGPQQQFLAQLTPVTNETSAGNMQIETDYDVYPKIENVSLEASSKNGQKVCYSGYHSQEATGGYFGSGGLNSYDKPYWSLVAPYIWAPIPSDKTRPELCANPDKEKRCLTDTLMCGTFMQAQPEQGFGPNNEYQFQIIPEKVFVRHG